ncbi:hypothetical protein ACLBR5_12550 [Escherichia coli]
MLHRAYFGKRSPQIASQELPGMSLRELFMILLLVVLLVLLGSHPQPDSGYLALRDWQYPAVVCYFVTTPQGRKSP